jgi:hypothetical protein
MPLVKNISHEIFVPQPGVTCYLPAARDGQI